ncbi:hypothetical protein C8Q78DRAFT_1040897 [Trametes maxima]|nr:hypothetical protein C8Q78DRAFT_1040897 [Trametes maxima]
MSIQDIEDELPDMAPHTNARPRRKSSAIVARTGIPGDQFSLNSEGIDIIASQLPEIRSSCATAKEERRCINDLVQETALNYAEDRGAPRPIGVIRRERAQSLPASHAVPARIRRDIIDGKQNPPLLSDAQTRRVINEIGRSRSGAAAFPTNKVVLERNLMALKASSASYTGCSTQLVEGVTHPASIERCQPGSLDFPPLSDNLPLAPPSSTANYAAAVAKPFDYQAARMTVLPEQCWRTSTSGPKRSASMGSLSVLRSTHDDIASENRGRPSTATFRLTSTRGVILDLPMESREPERRACRPGKQVETRGLGFGSASSSATSAAARPPAQGSMRGSMLSVTTHACLPGIAQLFGARKDIVPSPNPTTSGSRNRTLDESSHRPVVDAEAEDICSDDDGLLLFGGGPSSHKIARRVPSGSSSLDESRGSDSFSPATARAALKLPGAPPSVNVDGISGTPTDFGPYFGLSGSRSGDVFLPQARSGAALSGESLSIDSCANESGDTAIARGISSCSDATSPLSIRSSGHLSARLSEGRSPEASDDSGVESSVASLLAAEIQFTVLHPTQLIQGNERHARASSLSSGTQGQLRHCAADVIARLNSASHQQPRRRQTTAPALSTPSSISLLEHRKKYWETRDASQRRAQSTAHDSTPSASSSAAASSSRKENDPPARGGRNYDAWAFESKSNTGVSFPNRGHQPAPGPVGRRRHASNASGRRRTQTAPGQVGTGMSGGSGRQRTFSGRFDVLESEEFI